MKKNTLEKLYLCMKNKSPEITMPQQLLERALIPIQKMMEMS
jgi:quinolinate synthase